MAGNDPPIAKGKGKGKSIDEDTTSGGRSTESAPTDGQPSVLSRIAQSAASLGRDVVSARPSGGDLVSLTSTDKGGRASRGQPSAAAAAGEGSASATFPRSAAPQSGSSSHSQQHAMAQDEAFSQFLDGTSIDMSMPAEPIISLDDNALFEQAWTHRTQSTDVPSLTTTTATTTHSIPPPSSAVAEQERLDGLDVVNLLAGAGPPEEEPDYGDIELAEDESRALKLALFGDRNSEEQYVASTTSHDWDTVLNFIPDFVRPSPGGEYEDDPGHTQSRTGAPTKSRETQAALGMPHSSESTRQWLEQWQGVLTRYDDEVWGGLSPLVAQARDEVDQLQQSETDSSPPDRPPASTKALDRLRQILGHLRED
ncbi:uncharacterized protein SPSK_01817 [Sporothrix schenckii 1099-18]|uniref:Uncharacterized protein n=1 Tax=Sporothrix schenckii 1099-18 TaxID=1397361 RepID=A0A0F2MFK3_SPOSC|nr:uncharacterized protein SPSK_01817 [Sporothrix schenckii 1099-18]KJR86931.1 hypothetical protein SPSK_01817 [Sporothrix schenckii 1099-18]